MGTLFSKVWSHFSERPRSPLTRKLTKHSIVDLIFRATACAQGGGLCRGAVTSRAAIRLNLKPNRRLRLRYRPARIRNTCNCRFILMLRSSQVRRRLKRSQRYWYSSRNAQALHSDPQRAIRNSTHTACDSASIDNLLVSSDRPNTSHAP
jgi:hypothetical protein